MKSEYDSQKIACIRLCCIFHIFTMNHSSAIEGSDRQWLANPLKLFIRCKECNSHQLIEEKNLLRWQYNLLFNLMNIEYIWWSQDVFYFAWIEPKSFDVIQNHHSNGIELKISDLRSACIGACNRSSPEWNWHKSRVGCGANGCFSIFSRTASTDRWLNI